MVSQNLSALHEVLAIDIGATNTKFCRIDAHGEMLEPVRKRPTPYPCTPERLVEFLRERIMQGGVTMIGAGFPGEFDDGHVIRPGNLSRPGGVTTEVDPALEQHWRGFALQDALCRATQRDVRVVNDARLAALGCVEGHGIELVLTLGTGLGLALAVDGQMKKVRDVGAEVYLDGQTFDQLLGERSRSLDEEAWLGILDKTIAKFTSEFGATTVHLAGGNARRVSPDYFSDLNVRIVINGNQAPLRGAAKLFYG